MLTNGLHLIALWLHYKRVDLSCQVVFNFFFVGCGRVGVGARVWALGCGCVGRRDEDGRARDGAGWIGIVAVGCARIASLGFPIPDSDCWLGCDR